MSEQWELGIEALKNAMAGGGKQQGSTHEKRMAAHYVLNNAYELPDTPDNVRLIICKADGDRYVIAYEAYCVYCGEAWADDEYPWWGDVESALLIVEGGVDAGGFDVLDDGRVVCAYVDKEHTGCSRVCMCKDCDGKDKLIGRDQRNCTDKIINTCQDAAEND